MSDDEERAAIARCLTGESRAFAVLVDSYQRVLFNVALRMVNDKDDAEDVVQASFVKAYEKLHTYDRRRKFFSWIYRITVNECLNHLARRKRHEPGGEDETSRGPEDAMEQREVEAVIGAALLDLSIDYRGAIILRHFVHLSHREMSRVLDVPEKTVKSRLHTARKLLGELLAKRGVTRA